MVTAPLLWNRQTSLLTQDGYIQRDAPIDFWAEFDAILAPPTIVAPTLAGSSQNSAVNGSSVTVNRPTGIVDGQVMVMAISLGSGRTITGGLTGWTQIVNGAIGSGNWLYVYSKVASSEPASITVTFSAADNYGIDWMTFAGSSGIGNTSVRSILAATTTTPMIPTTINSLVLSIVEWNGDALTGGSGLTQDYMGNIGTPPSACSLYVGYKGASGWFEGEKVFTDGAGARFMVLATVEVKGTLSAGAYSLIAGAGAFTEVGQAVNLLASRVMTADLGTTALTGQDVAFTRGFGLIADAGTFTEAGQSVNLVASRLLAIGTGAFTEAGQDVGLLISRLLSIGTGAFTEAGQDVGLLVGRAIAAGTGSGTLSGQDVNLLMARVLTASAATDTHAGQSVNLLVGRMIAAAAGAYTLTGQDVALTVSALSSIIVGTGAFSASGQDVNLVVGRIVTASPGAMTLTGRDVGLLWGRVLQASTGAVTLTGQDVALLVAHILAAGTGTFNEAGQPVSLLMQRVIAAGAAAAALSGKDVALLTARLIAAGQGSYTLTGRDVELIAGIVYNGMTVIYGASSVSTASVVGSKSSVASAVVSPYNSAAPAGESAEAVIINPGYASAEYLP